ncbi:MAG: ElyC/SanA/YdcF family protein [Candidatus Omnitrophica bacterium]|nr:ElyC/SanA/YdcF family protein [Candidatus Omnitrophota bacterium]
MLKNENIICISSIDWDFIWQGHQEIMSTFAANGNRILFVENTGVRPPTLQDFPRLMKRARNWIHSVKGIRKEGDNLYIYSPIVLPFPYSRIARFINRHLIISALKRWIKSVSFSNPIIWTFLPTGLVLDIIKAVDSKAVVYYCIDNFEASSPQAGRIRHTENKLLERADLVFVTSQNLYDKCVLYSDNVRIFPYGVNLEVYEKSLKSKSETPVDIAAIRHPIVGYVGGVHKWIDFELIKFLSKTNPDKAFVFVGPLQRSIAEFEGIDNVHFLGQKRYEELPLYISQFDACVIPYTISEYTSNVYPTKINEYLFLGKPVISTAIPEVEAFNSRNEDAVLIGRTKEEFSAHIDRAVSRRSAEDAVKKRVEVAIREGSWKVKIEKMSELIEEKVIEKERQRLIHWKDNFLLLYKKRLAPVIIFGAIAYLLLFHTPFIWLVAKPLKLSSPIKNANAIIVLAGGVGESGKAGQGYEERVKYGVELYKKGYAPELIFSSGNTYVFKEAEVMKALALSLGIPERAIIIEECASGSYENIKFSMDLIRGLNQKSAIIISSPYHMLRVSLICKKVAPDIECIYAPIPTSYYYGDEKRVELKHIRGIIYEYVAILYYRLKGYV